MHLPSANWIFTIKHVYISYDVTGSRINFDTFQFDVDQFCVRPKINISGNVFKQLNNVIFSF